MATFKKDIHIEGNITLSGTVDGIDIGTEVPAKLTAVISGDNVLDVDITDPQNPVITITISGPYGNDADAAANGVPVGGFYHRSKETGFEGLLAVRLT